jgi:hypothetical protein
MSSDRRKPQIHAPMTPQEERDAPARFDRSTLQFWGERGGWCSCCLAKGTTVVHMGRPDRYVGICLVCIGRINEAARKVAAP